MTLRRSLLLAVFAAGVVVAGVGPTSAALAAPQPPRVDGSATPTATSDHPTATQGSLVRVEGTAWGKAGTGVVNVQVCGNAAANRSADCDLANTASGAIRPGGTFFTAITVHAPPRPCPCVLRVTSSTTPYEVRIPITIPGVATAPVMTINRTTRSVRLSKVSVGGASRMAAWFGAASKRTLRFSITNTGDVTLDRVAIDLAFGKGDHPMGFVAPPEVPPLVPGETRTVKAEITMAPLSLGTYHVTIDADPIGGITGHGSATTSSYPWGLFLVALILLQLVLLRIRNRMRRRLETQALREYAADGDPALASNAVTQDAVSTRSPPDPTPETLPTGAEVNHDVSTPDPGPGPSSADADAVAPAGRPARARHLRTLQRSVLVAALAISLLGCSGSSGGSAKATTTSAPNLAKGCPLHLADAVVLIGGDAKTATPPPLVGVQTPVTRCAFGAHERQLQLTGFTGPNMARSVAATLLGAKAEPDPNLGDGGTCASGTGTTTATATCVWTQGGKSYVLGDSMPVKEFKGDAVGMVRTVAHAVSARLPKSPAAATHTTTTTKP